MENNNFLNLPETSFAMRGDLAKREPEILNKWIADDVYQLIRNAKQGKPLFILHDGPPYANGNLHLGHAFNKILKDIIIKTKGLQGFDVPYIPGWDCHGLPIEKKIEDEHGKVGVNLDAASFRKICREYAASQVEVQRKDFIRLGVFADWYKPYLTMNYATEGAIIKTLGRIVAKGHVQKGFKPIYWCPDCNSSLAEAEVEYAEKRSESIYVAFKAADQALINQKFGLAPELPVKAVIWTTTPWTIPANRAITVNAEFIYQVVKITIKEQVSYLIVAQDLTDAFIKETKAESFEVVGKQISGKDLELVEFLHPLYNFVVPILNGDHVSLEAGTGLVHTAPAHGIEDFEICKQYNIEIADLLDQDTQFKSNVEFFAGLKVFDANIPVIKELFNHGALVFKSSIRHSYPHCWRHKSPIIYRATPQWFIKMDLAGLRNNSLDEIKKTKWVPSWGEERITAMVEGRPDWCISRQRIWGVPITLFTHKLTGDLHPDTQAIFTKAEQIVNEKGIQGWWDTPDSEIIADSQDYIRASDTLDVWFDSGSTSLTVIDALEDTFKQQQIDLYLEGSDQHRGWFMSSLMISCAVKQQAPYKTVLTHGFVVDGNGHKMSKSVGNTILPSDVNNKYGADILRLWVASTDYSSEMSISDEILKRTTESYRRIRNTARFLLANLNGFNPATDLVAYKDMIELDLWAVNLVKSIQEEITASSNSYEFHVVVQRLIKLCSIEMGSFYLDIIKDRQYTAKSDSLARKSCQTAIYYIAHYLVKWISPILSFTAQEIWEHLVGADSKYIFTEEYFNAPEGLPAVDNQFWEEVVKIRDQVNIKLEELRKDKVIGSGLEAQVEIFTNSKYFNKLNDLGNELRFILLTSQAKLAPLTAKPADLEDTIAEQLAIKVSKVDSSKCDRCWHHVDTVGSDANHPELCDRCVSNVYGSGEIRKFA